MTAALANAIDPRVGSNDSIREFDREGDWTGYWVFPEKPLIAASDALRAHAWRPIADAPKDGTEILLYGAGYLKGDARRYSKCCHVGWFDGEDWNTRDVDLLCEATHWQPLPAAPGAGDE